MKVCILSHCFYPSKKRGGPTVSITNMVKNLADKCELSVITTIFDKGADKPYDNVVPGKNKLFDSDVYYLTQNTYKAFYLCLSEIKPDVIYVSSLFSHQYSVAALKYARKHKNVRLVIAPRGELMPLALKRKFAVKFLFICAAKIMMSDTTEFHVTSQEEEQAVKKYFKKNRLYNIKNLPSKVSAGNEILPKSPGCLKVVMIGRIHPIKNIDYAIKLMSDIKGDVTLDIYGPEEDERYVEQCKQLSRELPHNVNVCFKGIVNHEEVGNVLKHYHVFLSPTKSENYGHSIIESLLCSVPVIISSNTPWHNLENNCAGYDFDLSQKELFVSSLQKFVDMNADDYYRWSRGAHSYIKTQLGVEDTVEKYIQMLINK